MRLDVAIVAFLLTPPGVPSGGFHWQRTITPPPGAATSQACVVLDAATFANAAPALRDLRLFQDGFELPYAIEESYDPRALESGETPADDRSLYEPVATTVLSPRRTASYVSFATNGKPVTPPPSAAELEKTASHDLYGSLVLPARIPVERLRLEPAPSVPTELRLRVTQGSAATAETIFRLEHSSAPAESIVAVLDAAQQSAPLTLGANLQQPATVTLRLAEAGTQTRRVTLEMRRRSLCYQPRSASPLTLYLGGGPGMTAKSYSYASTFSTALDRPYATLGPLVPNPDDTAEIPHPPPGLRQKRLLWAAGLAVAFFAFSASRMLRPARRTSHPG